MWKPSDRRNIVASMLAAKNSSDPEFRKKCALTPNFLTPNFGKKKHRPEAVSMRDKR
jgi:hypothetical protein